jgi:hypothetical protein
MTFDGRSPRIPTEDLLERFEDWRQLRRPVKVFCRIRGRFLTAPSYRVHFAGSQKNRIRLQRFGNPVSLRSLPCPTICYFGFFMLLCSKLIADAGRKD